MLYTIKKEDAKEIKRLVKKGHYIEAAQYFTSHVENNCAKAFVAIELLRSIIEEKDVTYHVEENN